MLRVIGFHHLAGKLFFLSPAQSCYYSVNCAFFYLVQFSFSHLERPTPSLLVKPHCEFVYFYGCKKKKKTGKKEKEKHMRARTNQISLLSRVVAGGDDNFPVINEFR